MPPFLSDPLFIVFASITVTSVDSTIAYHWSKVRRSELEAALKQEMIQRGMSADEIQQVLEATGRKDAKKDGADGKERTRPREQDKMTS